MRLKVPSMSRSRLSVTNLVAVDYSQPAIWLGLGLIGGGLSLYQLRSVQPRLSRDFDVVVSSVVIFSGGILIFQVLAHWSYTHRTRLSVTVGDSMSRHDIHLTVAKIVPELNLLA